MKILHVLCVNSGIINDIIQHVTSASNDMSLLGPLQCSFKYC